MTQIDRLSLAEAMQVMGRIQETGSNRDWRMTVRKSNHGGLTAHQTTEVQAIEAGFDWEAGQVILVPAKPLTELTVEQVADIQASVRKGSSWHAYQNDRKLREKISELELEIRRLRSKT